MKTIIIPRVSDPPSVMKADRRSQGSTLVFLIVLMVIFAVLGVGMLSMFGSSVFSVFASNSVRRANYMAESGLRYAISEVRNALPTTVAREAALTVIDDGINVKWFNVFPGEARYQVRVQPYWSKTTTTGANITTVAATVPNSGFPPGYAIPGVGGVARLQVGPNSLVGISSVTGDTPGSKAVTYTLASAVTLPAGAYANLAYPTTNTSQTVTKGSAATPLVVNINAVSAPPIPLNNGLFTDNATGRLHSYRTARLDSSVNPHTVILENISWLSASATATFPAGSYLIFPQAARLDATGDVTGGVIHTQRDSASAVTLFGLDSMMSMPGPNQRPPALSDSESGFSGDLGALDLSKSGNRVVVQGYIATGGTHSYWAAIQHLGEAGYRFEDPEEPGRDIGFHVVPIANDISDNLRNTWMQYNNLSYDIQIKNGWDLNKYSGASGLAFRWHETEDPNFKGQVPPGNDPYRYYQGYGITFMIYRDDNHGSADMIPNNIKPPGNSLNKTLLLVLWEQKVDAGGVPRKDWLAYALLGDPSGNYHNPATERHDPDPDQKVTGYQVWPDGRLNDNATIVVRVVDKFVTSGGVTARVNDIKVFYGDASEYTFQNDSRTKDSVAVNKQRARYYPKWLETSSGGILAPINPQWPSNQFGLNGNSIAYWDGNATTYDYFSLTSTAPLGPYNSDGQAVRLVKNNSPRTGFSAVNLLADNCTIRTTDFVLDSFPSGRKEIGLVGMGDISGPNLTVAFDDFYIQMLGGL